MSPVEEIKIDASKLKELPFRLMGTGSHYNSLARINNEIRDEFHRMDSKRRLESGTVTAKKQTKSQLY
jgi:hypothetical protein